MIHLALSIAAFLFLAVIALMVGMSLLTGVVMIIKACSEKKP